MGDNRCSYCGEDMMDLAHRCKFCGQYHCAKHLLPEDHDCPGLEGYKNKLQRRWQNLSGNKTQSRETQTAPILSPHSSESKKSKHLKTLESSKRDKKDIPEMKDSQQKIIKSLKLILPFLKNFIIWGVVCSIALIISSFVVEKLFFTNPLLIILFSAFIVSILVETFKVHDDSYHFRIKWVFFYFLIYSITIWLMYEFVLGSYGTISDSLKIGFVLSAVLVLVNSLKPRSRALPGMYIILLVILLVGNLGNISTFIPSDINPFVNQTELSEANQVCPTAISSSLSLNKANLENEKVTTQNLITLINSSVWQTENLPKACYKGKYVNQNPNWYYCDNMILSRWEMSGLGTIRYRWYTAVTSVWQSPEGSSPFYKFYGFECENGKRVTVEKGVTNYYVYDSRDGTQIKIKY
jgi:hypothetical protein